jgi:hypothetical protein
MRQENQTILGKEVEVVFLTKDDFRDTSRLIDEGVNPYDQAVVFYGLYANHHNDSFGVIDSLLKDPCGAFEGLYVLEDFRNLFSDDSKIVLTDTAMAFHMESKSLATSYALEDFQALGELRNKVNVDLGLTHGGVAVRAALIELRARTIEFGGESDFCKSPFFIHRIQQLNEQIQHLSLLISPYK